MTQYPQFHSNCIGTVQKQQHCFQRVAVVLPWSIHIAIPTEQLYILAVYLLQRLPLAPRHSTPFHSDCIGAVQRQLHCFYRVVVVLPWSSHTATTTEQMTSKSYFKDYFKDYLQLHCVEVAMLFLQSSCGVTLEQPHSYNNRVVDFKVLLQRLLQRLSLAS